MQNERSMWQRQAVFEKSKKLHHLESVEYDVSKYTSDRSEWVPPLQKVYQRKWGSHLAQKRENILDVLRQTEGHSAILEWAHIVQALDTIAKQSKRDAQGLCVFLLSVLSSLGIQMQLFPFLATFYPPQRSWKVS